jgi:hypothetical protein
MRSLLLAVVCLFSSVSYAGKYDSWIPRKSMSLDEAKALASRVHTEARNPTGDAAEINTLRAEIKDLLAEKEAATLEAQKKKDNCRGDFECVKEIYDDLRVKTMSLNKHITEKQNRVSEFENQTKTREANAQEELLPVLEGAILAVILRGIEEEFEKLKSAGVVLETTLTPELLRGKADPLTWLEKHGAAVSNNSIDFSTTMGLHYFYRTSNEQVEAVALLVFADLTGNRSRRFYSLLQTLFYEKPAQIVGIIRALLEKNIIVPFNRSGLDFSYSRSEVSDGAYIYGLVIPKMEVIAN